MRAQDHAYDYRKQIATEIAQIERIRNLKLQALSLGGALILSAGTFLATSASGVFLNYMTYGRPFGGED